MNPTKKQKKKRVIPFSFALEALSRVSPHTKLMFGCTAIYVENKIVLILRDRRESKVDNGVWLATTAEHHVSLLKEFPSLRSLEMFGPGPTGWQVLPVDATDFEESVFRACELIVRGDERIGKVPKSKRPKQKAGT